VGTFGSSSSRVSRAFHGDRFTTIRSPVTRGGRIDVWAIRGSESAKGGRKYWHTRTGRKYGYSVTLFASMCPGGEIGRRNGLKIRFPATGVWVQFPPRAPFYFQYFTNNAIFHRAASGRPVCYETWPCTSTAAIGETAKQVIPRFQNRRVRGTAHLSQMHFCLPRSPSFHRTMHA
jgi:hypothetical protein